MGKYAPLGEFLRKQRMSLVPMTFAEIERITGTKLPKSQRYPAWWSNNPGNNVMTQIWLDAGFETEQVDIGGRKLVFRRVSPPSQESETGASLAKEAGASKRHPLIGWMKGTFTIAPGVDLTEPADPHGDKSWDAAK